MIKKEQNELKNVLGTPLEICCSAPMTGYFRDGYCRTTDQDQGTHVVCAVVTEKFLRYTHSKGNDLSTPRPEWSFLGLKPGDRWCLCVRRWIEAEKAGAAPSLLLEATDQKALDYVSLSTLKRYAHKISQK